MTDRTRSRHVPELVIGSVFLVTQVVFSLAGVRLDRATLTAAAINVQLLDFPQLQHHLVESIWYLQSQPPAFNVATGIVLHLPAALISPVLILTSAVFTLLLAASCYWLCLELRLPVWVATTVSVLVLLDPATVLYAHFYFYSLPTAALLTFAALALARFVRTDTTWWGVAFFCGVAAVVLLNSTFQWEWLVLGVAPLAIRGRRHWRRLLTLAAVPLLIVLLWYVKNAVLFGTTNTSSWFGMNMARITTSKATTSQLDRLVAEGRISRISLVGPFAYLAEYGPTYTAPVASGVPVLNERIKENFDPNFNNLHYISISNTFLHDDLAYIRAYPDQYATNVTKAVRLFFVPSDQYQLLAPNATAITDYQQLFDFVVDWQPTGTDIHTVTTAADRGDVPPFSAVSIGAVLTYLVTLLATPFVAWRRRKDAVVAITLAFIWVSTAYVFVLTSLVDLGENERFRFDLGPLPLVAALATIAAVVTTRRSARRARSDATVAVGAPSAPASETMPPRIDTPPT